MANTKKRALSQAQKDYNARRRREKQERDRAVKRKLTEAKAKGLYKGDVRKVKVTSYHKNLVSLVADVLSGKAKAVKVSPKAAKTLPNATKQNRGSVRKRGNIAILPVKDKAERISFNEKTGEISSYVEVYGRRYKRVLVATGIESVDQLPDAPKGKVYHYGLVSKQGGAIRFQSKEEFRKFLAEYKADEKALMPHVEILIPLSGKDKHHPKPLTAPAPKTGGDGYYHEGSRAITEQRKAERRRARRDRSNTRKSKG